MVAAVGSMATLFHLVFTNTKGHAIRRDNFNESAWHRTLRACRITPAGSTGIHQLRHHVASMLLSQGLSIAEVAEVLGDTVQESVRDLRARHA